MTTITKEEAEKMIGKSLNFLTRFMENGNRLYVVSNVFGTQIYGVIKDGSCEGVLETTLKDFNEVCQWADANDIPPKDLMKDPVLLENYPIIS